MVVVPCARWVPMTVSDSSCGARGEGGAAAAVHVHVDEAGDDPVAGQVDHLVVRPRGRRARGVRPAGRAFHVHVGHVGHVRRVRRVRPARRLPSTVSPAVLRVRRRAAPPGPRSAPFACSSARGTSAERRSQARSPAPRQPAASPRAAGTMCGSGWNVTVPRPPPAAERRGCRPASARPPPMISVRGSSRVSPVTRPVASASMASRHTAGARGSPDSTALARVGRRGRRVPARRGPGAARRRRRRPAPPGSRAARSRTRARRGVRRCGRSPPRCRARPARPAVDADGARDAGAQRHEQKRSTPLPAPMRPSARPPVRTSWPSATGSGGSSAGRVRPSRSLTGRAGEGRASRGWRRRRRCPAPRR